MKTCSKVFLLAAGLAAVLLLCSAPTAEASRAGRTLSQWSNSGSTFQGWGWGPGWGFGPNPMDPVGSGCWDANTGYRYRNGESQYCAGGGRRRCSWGEWEGSCRSSSGGDNSGWDNGWDNSWEDAWNRKK